MNKKLENYLQVKTFNRFTVRQLTAFSLTLLTSRHKILFLKKHSAVAVIG